MKVLKNVDLEDIVFIDIETSYAVEKLEIDSELFESWKYKVKGDKLDNQEILDSYYREAALYADFGRIVCISVGRLFDGKFITTTFNDLDEKTLIKNFNDSLTRMGSSIKKEGGSITICGHNIKSFDIPFIFQRSIINSTIPHPLMDVSGEKPWTMDWILDTKDLWQAGGFNRSGLVNITTALGLPSPKNGITGAQVPAYFWKNPEGNIKEISEYCERDVVAVYDIMNKFKNIETEFKNTNDSEKPNTNIESFIESLFNGARYTKEHKVKLLDFLKTKNKSDQTKVFVILESIVSTASGKKTKFTKEHIKELKAEI